MPFALRKKDSKWQVYNRATGRVLGTHDDRAKARAQLSALYANGADAKSMSETENEPLVKPPDEDCTKALVHCATCQKDVTPDSDGCCPECGEELDEGEADKQCKKDEDTSDTSAMLSWSYAKSLGLALPDDELVSKLAVKRVSPDTVHSYTFIWGNPDKRDVEREYFDQQTDFWDRVIGKSARPLTWDHAQDKDFKASPVIGQIVDWGDDELGRWYEAKLDQAHQYRKAVDALIERGVLGSSSDSAPQYIVREQKGSATYLKQWPWFATALTHTPCEPRTLGTTEFLKSIGVNPEELLSRARLQDTREARNRRIQILKLYV